MNKYIQKRNQVSICYKRSCVHAAGKNADKIATGATIMLLFVGIAAIIRASN